MIYRIGKPAEKFQFVFECCTFYEAYNAMIDVYNIENVDNFRRGTIHQNRRTKIYSVTFFEKNSLNPVE